MPRVLEWDVQQSIHIFLAIRPAVTTWQKEFCHLSIPVFHVGNVFVAKALIRAKMLFFCHVPSDFYVLWVWWHLLKQQSVHKEDLWITSKKKKCKFLCAVCTQCTVCGLVVSKLAGSTLKDFKRCATKKVSRGCSFLCFAFCHLFCDCKLYVFNVWDYWWDEMRHFQTSPWALGIFNDSFFHY